MELIKKTIERILTTGATVPCSYRNPETGILITGCTATTRLLVPNKSPNLFYYFKISLVQDAEDIGFFDAYISPPLSVLTVATSTFDAITKSSALGGGNVLADGGYPVTERGLVYSLNPNPTTGNTKKISGSGLGQFSVNLTGLTINTTYYAKAYAINSKGIVYGAEVVLKTLDISAISTKPVIAITTSGATTGGEIATDGGSSIIRRGVVWNTGTNPTLSNGFFTINGYGIGSYNSILTGLTTLTTYYVRAYATNMTETTYGNELSFITIGLPSVTTATVTTIGAINATGGGNVTSEGGTSVFEKGVVVSTSHNPTIDDMVFADGTGTGTFTSSIAGLVATTRYYVRAYAKNIVGVAYGNEVAFDTIAVPTVVTSQITNIQANSATGGGTVTSDGGSSVTARGVQFGNAPGAYSRITNDGAGTGVFVSNLSSLAPTTMYYARAYATNSAGNGYGVEYSFSTTAVLPPVVTTIYALDITTTTAIIRAGVGYTGSHTITERGVVWATNSGPDQSSNKQINNSGNNIGNYDTTITGLFPNLLYYVRAYAYTAEEGYIYGNQITFTTAAPVLATLGAFSVTSIASNNAIGNSSVDSDGGAAVSQRGFVWSTSPNPTTANSKVTSGSGTGAFSTMMFGMNFNTVYYARAYAINTAGTSYSNEVSFLTLPIAPVVSTQGVTSIGSNYATGNGTVENNGGSAITSRGFVMGQTSGSYPININAGSGDGGFYANLGPFIPNTTYYVKAYATNSIGTSYGGETSFTSLQVQPPVVTTIYALDITMTTAIIRAGVAYTGSHVISERGVVWATNSGPDQTSNKQINNSGNNIGNYDTNIGGLSPNLLYYVRAYAYTAEEGYIYGNQITFTTAAPTAPTLGTFSVGSITYNSANGSSNVTSDGGAAVSQRGFVWSTTPGPTTANSKVTSGSGTGAFTGTLAVLYYNTTYYARAYATNSAGTTYSNEISFTTSPIAPVVSTQGVTSIGSNYATGNGTVENDGGSAITSRGFVMGQTSGVYPIQITEGNTGTGIFYANLGPIIASTTYYVRACATNAYGTTCGGETSFTSLPVQPPVVTTINAMSITYNSATIRAGIAYTGSHTISERGVVWATNSGPDQSSNKQTNGTGAGNFDTPIAGLSPNILYYVRAYAYTAEEGYIYGNQITFTSAAPSAPTVTTTAFVTISENSASNGGGTVTSDGGAFVSSRGIVYSTSPNPTIAGSKTIDGSGAGAFSSVLGSLASTTLYYYRAYATNSSGTGYGSELTFTTLTPPPYICAVARTNTAGCKVGGVLKLFKADGTFVSSITAFPPATEWGFCNNTVNAACSYYVDFSAMGMYTSSNASSTCHGINWNIKDATYGTSVCTSCFTPSGKVCGCIY